MVVTWFPVHLVLSMLLLNSQSLSTYFILWLLAVLGKKEIVVVRIVASEGLGHCKPANSLRKSHLSLKVLSKANSIVFLSPPLLRGQ